MEKDHPQAACESELEQVAGGAGVNLLRYTVKSGDTLEGIASRFGVSARTLARINNIREAKPMRVGQTLLIPQAR